MPRLPPRALLLAALLAAAPAGSWPVGAWAQAAAAGAAGAATGPAAAAGGGAAVDALAGEAALSRLLDVLRDDGSRAALVTALEGATDATAGGAATDAAGSGGGDGAASEENLAERLAALTLGLAEALRAEGALLWAQIASLGRLGERLPAWEAQDRRAAAALAATILSTVAAALLLDAVAGALARRLARPPGGPRRLRRALAALLLHAGAVLGAWAAGVTLAVLLFSEAGRPWTSQAFYLNAFLAFGAARIALRAAASPDAGAEPALSTLDPAAQRAIYRALRPVAALHTQGLLFAVPLAHLWGGFALARPARTLVATLAALAALWAIRRIRRALGAARAAHPEAPPASPPAAAPPDRLPADPPPGLIGPPAPPPPAEAAPPAGAVAEGLGSAWRALWPPLAALYVLYAWLVAVTRPALAEGIVLAGTASTVAALALVGGALRFLRWSPRARAPLPARTLRALPTLGPRADRIAAALAAALALLLLLSAPAVALLGWDWVDLRRLAPWPRLGQVAGQALSAGLVVLAAAALWALVASVIDARLAGSTAGRDSSRSRTLLALFRNAFTVAVATVAAMVALSQLGLDIAPLLAGAGVVGLAVGFGAQTLVKDVITGVFIQLEGAMDVGDVVTVAGITGGVETITVRSVRLRTMDGATHVIPFSSVTTVTNMTRDYGYHVADLVVGYGQSVPAVRAAMEEAFARLLRDPLAADVDGGLDMQGVAEMRGDALLVRARIRTRAGRQWDVGRRYSELLKAVLDERGIEVPAPTRTILVPHGGAALPGAAPA